MLSLRNLTSLNLLNELSRLFDRDVGSWDDSRVEGAGWVPAVDISEGPKQFTLLIDVPGVKPEQVEISMEGNVLSLRGEKEEKREENKGQYHRVERMKGVFYRSFTLPHSADSEQISARARDGVLEISIGKKSLSEQRRIPVKLEG